MKITFAEKLTITRITCNESDARGQNLNLLITLPQIHIGIVSHSREPYIHVRDKTTLLSPLVASISILKLWLGQKSAKSLQ